MMPDLEEPPEHVDYSRPAVNDALAPHDFVASEFDPDCGRCDRCGGGPGAEIHQKPVDQMARIADALDCIDAHLVMLLKLKRIGETLARIADKVECQ